MSVEVIHHALGISWIESGGMSRTAHALSDGRYVWLIDPFDDDDAIAAVSELGKAVAVFQLLDRHNRDCEAIADRLQVPRRRLPLDAVRAPFEPIPVISLPVWHEVALWWPQKRALIVAEAVGTAPLFALSGAVGVHPMLRLLPPRKALSDHAPEALLVGHGRPLFDDASDALERAFAVARRDVPRLALKLPGLLRGG